MPLLHKPEHSCSPRSLPQGICYTYDDVIFHPGHIFFGAHEVRACTFCVPCQLQLLFPTACLSLGPRAPVQQLLG